MRSTIEKDVRDNKVFVYMKGVPAAPMCGFSMTVCRCGGGGRARAAAPRIAGPPSGP